MTAARLPDWQSRLAELIAARRAAPFAWGKNDCCTFACDCVRAMTGHDPARGLRGHRTAKDAAAALRDNGGLRALANARLGAAIAPAEAQVGDIGLATVEGRPALVVCGGSAWTGPGKEGLVSVPMSSVMRAWRAV